MGERRRQEDEPRILVSPYKILDKSSVSVITTSGRIGVRGAIVQIFLCGNTFSVEILILDWILHCCTDSLLLKN